MATATKQKPSKLAKPLPPCKVIYFTHRGGTYTSDGMDAFRRTIRGPWGDYQLAIPHGAPVLLVGQAEIDAFAKDLQAGSARELEIQPAQLETLVRELADEATANQLEALQTAADELLTVSTELEATKLELASVKQQLAAKTNPLADAS